MKKRLLCLSLVVCLIFTVLAGCKKSEEAVDSDPSKVSLSVGGWPSKEGDALDNMNKQKEAFEKKYPDVTIVGDTWTFDRQTFQAKAAANLLPNVFETGVTEMAANIEQGYTADVTDALKKHGYYDYINPYMKKIIEKDGRVYSLPMTFYAMGIAYNVSLFEKAGLMNDDGPPIYPKTWEELAKTAKKIKDKTGVAGFVFPTTSNNGGWMFTNLAWSYGVEFMKQDKNGNWKATFGTKECAKALQYIKDLKWKYDVLPANKLIDGVELYKTYAVGQAAMVMAADVIHQRVSAYDMDINDVGMFPMVAGPKGRFSMLGGGVMNISANSNEKQIDAAINWLADLGKCTPYLTEPGKAYIENSYKARAEDNQFIGTIPPSAWTIDSEVDKFTNEMINKYRNTDENHYKAFNDSLTDGSVEFHLEEPVCCQDLYAVLDDCIQKVLNDKNADCLKIVKEANKLFQTGYLDNFNNN